MWLKSPHEALSNPLSDEDFVTLMEHARVLGFWEDIVDVDLPPADQCWHFPPTALLRLFRTCDWLSLDELTQLLPRHYGLNHARSTLDWRTAQGRLSGNPISYADVCKAFRKYRISTANRRIAFLSQAYIETGLLRTTAEDGRGGGESGNAKYYRPFYGRGLMQITWPVLYDDYGKFRGFQNNNSGHYIDERITSTSLHDWSGPPSTDKEGRLHEDKRIWYPRYDPDLVASDGLSACDSAGYFIFWKRYMGTTNILRIADEGITTTTIGRISVLVNGGGSGYDDRQQYAAFLARYLSDSTDTEASATLSYRKQKITSVAHPHKHLEWGEYEDATSVYVDFTPQRES